MKALFLLFCVSALAYAQDTISASAMRNVTLPPDQAVFDVVAWADVSTSQDQVVQSLLSVGITAPNLVSVTSSVDCSGNTVLSYEFRPTVPFASWQATADKLGRLSNASFSVTGSASDTVIEQARQQVVPQLIAEARKSAERTARQSGQTLEQLVGVSDGMALGAYLLGFSTTLERSGDFSQSLAPTCASTSTSSSSSTIGQSLSIPFQINLTFTVLPRNGRQRNAR